LVGLGLGLGVEVCGWDCVVCDWVCVVCVCVVAEDDVDELEVELEFEAELEDDEDEDGFFAFFFGSLLSAGRPSGAEAPAVTAAAATSTVLGDASFAAAGADGFFDSLPDALLTPKATTNAARAAATAIPICRGCIGCSP
jgi:hypothetical protein